MGTRKMKKREKERNGLAPKFESRFYIFKQVVEKTKEVASKVSETAKDLGEKAKQRTQDAWESVVRQGSSESKKSTTIADHVETAKTVKDNIVEKAKESSKFTETTQNLGERAKQTTQDAWESAKKGTESTRNTIAEHIKDAQKVKDTIVEKCKENKLTDTMTGTVAENATGKTTEEIIWKTTDVVAEAAVGKVPKTIIKEGYKIIRDSVNKK
ncbi:hypothetical protein FRX31_016740 [Thalictrum thalictroides]|uniref:Late embryogenesis abundant protein n=1 Tax=Thalictrum thalictroides TaxID=46969 RepID=A0A7J6W8C7_THATH|nr:hypothetical protein FRX31_016740 [Thalictrum thalictroides]